MNSVYSNRIFVVVSLVCLAKCGKTTFRGEPGAPKNQALEANPPEDAGAQDDGPIETKEVVAGSVPLTGKGIEWFFQCESAPVALPKELKNGKTLVEGAGMHRVPRPVDGDLDLHVVGFLCPPVTMQRDIVVVVDVSGSTRNTDPAVRGVRPAQCERKTAVKSLVNQLKAQSGVNIGFVTFSTKVEYASPELLSVQQVSEGIYQNDNVCAVRDKTNYADALARAGSMLSSGRPGATKEVYFVTDGEPDSKDKSRAAAAELRNVATIATIMFGGGDDDHLKNEVASRNLSGSPIHALVADTKNLANALENLAKTTPVKGTFRYKPVASQQWQESDLWQYVKAGVFDIPPLSLDPEEFESGISFSYTYEDNHGGKVTYEGEISWE